MVVARDLGRGGNGELFSIRIEFQFYKKKKVLEMDGGDGYITMYLMSLNYTLKNSYNCIFCYIFATLKKI